MVGGHRRADSIPPRGCPFSRSWSNGNVPSVVDGLSRTNGDENLGESLITFFQWLTRDFRECRQISTEVATGKIRLSQLRPLRRPSFLLPLLLLAAHNFSRDHTS